MSVQKIGESPAKLSELAAQKIRAMIIKQELAPGEPIAELKLAGALGMSRTPIREALSQLEFEGTLQAIPGRGSIVAPITRSDFQEINDLRFALEPLAALSAINVIPRPVIKREKEKWARFLADFDAGEAIGADALTEEDDRLHALFIENCGNKRLRNMLKVLQFQAKRYIFAHWDTNAYVRETLEQHLNVVLAFEALDKGRLRSALEKHLEYNNMFIDIYKDRS